MAQSIADLFREAEGLDANRNAAAAVELYKRWIAFNPEDPHLAAALFNMAVVAQRNGDSYGAINALREAIRLDPDFHPPYINLGRQLEDQGLAGVADLYVAHLAPPLPEMRHLGHVGKDVFGQFAQHRFVGQPHFHHVVGVGQKSEQNHRSVKALAGKKWVQVTINHGNVWVNMSELGSDAVGTKD